MSFSFPFDLQNSLEKIELENKYTQENDKPKQKHIIVNQKVHQVSIHCIPPAIPEKSYLSKFASDNPMIEEAIKFYDSSDIGIAQNIFKNFLTNKLFSMRQNNLLTECCGLRGTNVKKFKCLVELDPNKQLVLLSIGRFFVRGGFTKVYLTSKNEAILIPRKDKDIHELTKAQLLQARNCCLKIHTYYNESEKHSEKIKDLLIRLNLFEGNFNKEKLLINNMLPPIPNMILVHDRPIMVLPRATPASEIFATPPTNLFNSYKRLKIIGDIAATLALLHEKKFIHGDIKPDNLLVNLEGKGQLHDFGGSLFFNTSQTSTEAEKQYSSLTITHHYTHYQDKLYHDRFKYLSASKDLRLKLSVSADHYLKLGQARDVFALAVSLIRAMIGIEKTHGTRQLPYNEDAYKEIPHHSRTYKYIIGTADQRTPITCLKAIAPEVDADFQALMDRVLDSKYYLRPTAHEFAISLHKICEKLLSFCETPGT